MAYGLVGGGGIRGVEFRNVIHGLIDLLFICVFVCTHMRPLTLRHDRCISLNGHIKKRISEPTKGTVTPSSAAVTQAAVGRP